MTTRSLRFALILLFALSVLLAGRDAAAQSTCSGQWYRVEPGDSWAKLAQRTGLSVAALKAANTAAANHPQGWLLVGQTLCLPAGAALSPAAAEPPAGPPAFPVTVRRGDSSPALDQHRDR